MLESMFTTQGHLGYGEVIVREIIQERGRLPEGELEHNGDIVAGTILGVLLDVI